MNLTFSCGLATASDSHEHAVLAESLGYERVFFFDSPAIHLDAWVEAVRAAERTERIDIGVAAVIPSNRHPMTNAAAIAHLIEVAGEDRVTVAFGSGFTARLTMGQKPLRWADVRRYVETVQALLAGERAEWDGAPVAMMHPPGWGLPRPVRPRYLIAASGPKGEAAARDLADGVLSAPGPAGGGFDWSLVQLWGTVLDEGEDPGSERALASAGPPGAVMLHAGEQYGQLEAVLGTEFAERYREAYADVSKEEEHLVRHYGHLAIVNERDRPFIDGELLTKLQLALPREGWREKLGALEAAGATEVIFQPIGDIPRELEAFAALR